MHTLHELAKIGASQRVKDLQAEIDSILKAFGPVDGDGNGKVKNGKAIRRRRISADARRRMSEAAKKRWAMKKEAEMKTTARGGRLQKQASR